MADICYNTMQSRISSLFLLWFSLTPLLNKLSMMKTEYFIKRLICYLLFIICYSFNVDKHKVILLVLHNVTTRWSQSALTFSQQWFVSCTQSLWAVLFLVCYRLCCLQHLHDWKQTDCYTFCCSVIELCCFVSLLQTGPLSDKYNVYESFLLVII